MPLIPSSHARDGRGWASDVFQSNLLIVAEPIRRMNADGDFENTIVAPNVAAQRLQPGCSGLCLDVFCYLRRNDHGTDLLLNLRNLFFVSLLDHDINRIDPASDLRYDVTVKRVDEDS